MGSIFIVELALTIGTCSTAWHVLGSEYGEIRSIVQMDTGSLTLQGLTAFSSLLAHCFYVWRIWRLTRSKIMPTIITTVSPPIRDPSNSRANMREGLRCTVLHRNLHQHIRKRRQTLYSGVSNDSCSSTSVRKESPGFSRTAAN